MKPKKQRPGVSLEEVAAFHGEMVRSAPALTRKKNFAAADLVEYFLIMETLETKRINP
jgi:hypothetical protein